MSIAKPTTDASKLTSGTLADARLSSAVQAGAALANAATAANTANAIVRRGASGEVLVGSAAVTTLTIANSTALAYFENGAGNYSQFLFREGGEVKAFIGYISPSFSDVSRRNAFEFGTGGADKITFRPGDVEMGRITSSLVSFNVPFRPGVYTVGTLPTPGTGGRSAYATNGRKAGQGAGAGTGVPVWDDGAAWRTADGVTVAA